MTKFNRESALSACVSGPGARLPKSVTQLSATEKGFTYDNMPPAPRPLVIYGGAASLPQVVEAMVGLEPDDMIAKRKVWVGHGNRGEQKEGPSTSIVAGIKLTRWTAHPVSKMSCTHAQYLRMMHRNGVEP